MSPLPFYGSKSIKLNLKLKIETAEAYEMKIKQTWKKPSLGKSESSINAINFRDESGYVKKLAGEFFFSLLLGIKKNIGKPPSWNYIRGNLGNFFISSSLPD